MKNEPPKPRHTREPHDRLTRICDQMTKTFDMHPEHRSTDKCIVFLGDDAMGGLVIHGYNDENEAMVDLLMHLRAIFAANGKVMDLIFMNDDGIDRIDG